MCAQQAIAESKEVTDIPIASSDLAVQTEYLDSSISPIRLPSNVFDNFQMSSIDFLCFLSMERSQAFVVLGKDAPLMTVV